MGRAGGTGPRPREPAVPPGPPESPRKPPGPHPRAPPLLAGARAARVKARGPPTARVLSLGRSFWGLWGGTPPAPSRAQGQPAWPRRCPHPLWREPRRAGFGVGAGGTPGRGRRGSRGGPFTPRPAPACRLGPSGVPPRMQCSCLLKKLFKLVSCVFLIHMDRNMLKIMMFLSSFNMFSWTCKSHAVPSSRDRGPVGRAAGTRAPARLSDSAPCQPGGSRLRDRLAPCPLFCPLFCPRFVSPCCVREAHSRCCVAQ